MNLIQEIEGYLSHNRQPIESKLTHIHTTTEEEQPVNHFQCSWNRLNRHDKINRLMVFHRQTVETHSLNNEAAANLQNLFYNEVDGILASDNVVIYNIITAKIDSIIGLKKEYNSDNFYLET